MQGKYLRNLRRIRRQVPTAALSARHLTLIHNKMSLTVNPCACWMAWVKGFGCDETVSWQWNLFHCLVLSSLFLPLSFSLSLSLPAVNCPLELFTFLTLRSFIFYVLCLFPRLLLLFFCVVLLVLSFWFRRDSFWTRVLCCLSMCGFIFG